MKTRLLVGSLASILCTGHLLADVVWSTAQIPVPPSFQGVNVDVIVTAGPTEGTAVAVWGESTTGTPYYSIYNNGTWTTGTISLPSIGATGVFNNIYVTQGPNAGELTATWTDALGSFSHEPFFSTYNGSTWSVGSKITSSPDDANQNVVVASGPNDGQLVAVWANGGTKEVYYSINDGTTWVRTLPIDLVNVALSDVFVCRGVIPNTMVATWTNGNNLQPFYSVLIDSFPEMWTPGAPISAASLVKEDVVCALDAASGQVVAVWTDSSSSQVIYSFFDGTTWTTPAGIPMGSSTGCFNDPYVVAEVPGQLVVTWADMGTNNSPFFSIYENGAWSAGSSIPPSTSTGAIQDVAVGRLAGTDIMIATWGDLNSMTSPPNAPFYSVFAGVPVPLAPEQGQGSHVKNQFALLTEWYNQLNWTASTSPDVTGYNIRRNGTLIAANVAGTSYQDNNRPKKGTDVYRITSVNAEGIESEIGLEITVTP